MRATSVRVIVVMKVSQVGREDVKARLARGVVTLVMAVVCGMKVVAKMRW